MDDQKIISLLKTGKESKAFLKLYQAYPKIEKLIRSKGGSREDAKDIFQEALMIFHQKVKTTDFKLTAAIGTYLYSVSRFLWKDELTKRKGKKEGDFLTEIPEVADEDFEMMMHKEARFKQIETVLTQIGEKCLKLLKLYYYEGLKMKVIADKLGLKSERVAKNQKYKCLTRAKQKVKAL